MGGDEVVAIADTCNRRAELTRDGRIHRGGSPASDGGREHQRTLVVYELDERGDLVRVVDMGGVEWRYEYDEEHYLGARSSPTAWSITSWHELVGGRSGASRPGASSRGRTCSAALGAPGEAGVPRALRAASIPHSCYGPDPLETTMVDGVGHVHRYRVNPLGQVLQYIDPRGYVRVYRYDDSGRLPVEHRRRRTDAAEAI